MCKGIKDLWTKATKRGVSSCLSGKTMHTLGPCLWKSSLRDSCPLQNASQSTLACWRSNLASGAQRWRLPEQTLEKEWQSLS